MSAGGDAAAEGADDNIPSASILLNTASMGLSTACNFVCTAMIWWIAWKFQKARSMATTTPRMKRSPVGQILVILVESGVAYFVISVCISRGSLFVHLWFYDLDIFQAVNIATQPSATSDAMEEFQVAWTAITEQFVVSNTSMIITANTRWNLSDSELKCLYPVAIVALVELQKSLANEKDYYTMTTATASELGIGGDQRTSSVLSAT